jgi:hypothetical protein
VHDKAQHSKEGQIFKKGGDVVNDSRFLVVRIHVYPSFCIILVRSWMAFPAGGRNVIDMNGRQRITGRSNVMNAMTAGAVGGCLRAEFDGNAMEALFKSGHLVHFNSILADDLLFLMAMLAGFDHVHGVNGGRGISLRLDKVLSMTTSAGGSICDILLIESDAMDAVDILSIDFDMTLPAGGGHFLWENK